jgi:hypothetical protein
MGEGRRMFDQARALRRAKRAYQLKHGVTKTRRAQPLAKVIPIRPEPIEPTEEVS